MLSKGLRTINRGLGTTLSNSRIETRSSCSVENVEEFIFREELKWI